MPNPIKRALQLFRKTDKSADTSPDVSFHDLIEDAWYGSIHVNATKAFSLYRQSSAISTAVDLIASKIETITPVIDRGGEIQDRDEITDFLVRPNDDAMWRNFIGHAARNYLLTGNTYLLGLGTFSRPPLELFSASPMNAHQRIDMPATLEAYLAGLGSRSKKSLNYSRRKLFRDFADDINLARCSTEDDVSGFLDKAISISKTTYQWHLLGLGLRRGDVLEERMRFAARQGWLRSYLLECSGQPAAFMLAYQYGGCFYYTDVGYAPDFASWSAGSMLQLLVMEDLYDQPDRPDVFDFATGYGEHKARFGNASRDEANWLLLPRSFRNTVLAGAYRRLDGLANLATSTADRMGVKQTLKKTVRRLSTGRAA